jgi:Tfp pilus assembly protein PilE
MKRSGFTWAEAVIVLFTICILISILSQVFHHPHRIKLRRAQCSQNLRLIHQGVQQYLADYDGVFPPADTKNGTGWVNAVFPYVGKWNVFQCPATASLISGRTDYFFNARASGLSKSEVLFKSQTILLGDGQNNSPTTYALKELPAAWRIKSDSPSFRHQLKALYLFVGGSVFIAPPDSVAATSSGKMIHTFAIK